MPTYSPENQRVAPTGSMRIQHGASVAALILPVWFGWGPTPAHAQQPYDSDPDLIDAVNSCGAVP